MLKSPLSGAMAVRSTSLFGALLSALTTSTFPERLERFGDVESKGA